MIRRSNADTKNREFPVDRDTPRSNPVFDFTARCETGPRKYFLKPLPVFATCLGCVTNNVARLLLGQRAPAPAPERYLAIFSGLHCRSRFVLARRKRRCAAIRL